MNRDEQLTRPIGLPPRLRKVNGRTVVYPSEPGGGTWITLNDAGVTLALINWYSAAARVKSNAASRGKIVTAVCPLNNRESITALLGELPLATTNPFRLIGVFPTTHEIAEWRWDLKKLVCRRHPWKAQQWISSGFDEPTAQRMRAATFRRKWRQRSAGTFDWLRRLHRSHSPVTGPFSTCMHRPDAATVSYTEVTVSAREAALRYHAGPPCQSSTCFVGKMASSRVAVELRTAAN